MAISPASRRPLINKPLALTFREINTLWNWGMPFEVPILPVDVRLHLLDLIAQECKARSPECKRDLQALDIFSGKGAVHREASRLKCKAEKYDIVEGDHCDLRTLDGFKHLLHLVLRLEEDGLAVFGLPCTSYVFMNAGTHCRSKGRPYGNESLQYIKDANLITSRTIMALMVITVRCGYWLVEQPGSSQLIHHPEMCYFLSLLEKSGLNFEFTRFWMGHWGARSPKPSMAFSNCPWTPSLKKTMTRKEKARLCSDGIVVKYMSGATGETKVHGGPKLKGTQVYPAKFARHVFKFHLKIKTERAHELRADMACAKIEDGPPEQVPTGRGKFFRRAALSPIGEYVRCQAVAFKHTPLF